MTQPDPTGRNAGTATGHLSENRAHIDHAATHSGQSQRLNLPHGRMDPLISRRQRPAVAHIIISNFKSLVDRYFII